MTGNDPMAPAIDCAPDHSGRSFARTPLPDWGERPSSGRLPVVFPRETEVKQDQMEIRRLPKSREPGCRLRFSTCMSNSGPSTCFSASRMSGWSSTTSIFILFQHYRRVPAHGLCGLAPPMPFGSVHSLVQMYIAPWSLRTRGRVRNEQPASA